VEKQVRNTLIN